MIKFTYRSRYSHFIPSSAKYAIDCLFEYFTMISLEYERNYYYEELSDGGDYLKRIVFHGEKYIL